MADDGDLDDLGRSIDALYIRRDEARRASFDRSLSFDESVSDRWERAQRLGFGVASSVYGSALIFGAVTVGESSWVGPWVLLDGSGGGLTIGSYCSISAGVHIYTHDTVGWAISGGALERRTGAVVIGDCCYVGPQTVIAAGVTIGSRAVIGANSFVNRDVADATVVGGSPARQIGLVSGEGREARIVLDARS